MEYILRGIKEAFFLIITGDAETFSAISVTIRASSLSIFFGLMIGMPIGFLFAYKNFPLKKQIRTFVDTLLAMPTVVVGLLVYTFISRQGPLGSLEILFSITGIVIAQIVLILPIIISLTATALESLDKRLKHTLITLGANKRQIFITNIYEARYALYTAAITAYGRAISEVGISMMIGGNIKWDTRTITTAIALESGKGDFSMGIALGIVLLLIAFIVNGSLIMFKRYS